MKELAKQYDPSQVEDRIYQFWLDGGYFHTEADPDKKPYTIVMPPPNVTGQLHMGHALDNTMQDVLIRTKRMQGYAALWVPGTDHASIATEAKVVEAMRAEGLTKEMVGRDGFLERAWDWKTRYGNRIVSQLKKLGTSCDWQRERFTMDEGLSAAVRKVFVQLYNEGLIYKGDYIINWCSRCHTALAEAEVEYGDHTSPSIFVRFALNDAALAQRIPGADPSRALYVGDSGVDSETAKNASLPCVLCDWGYWDRDRLENCAALGIISAPAELLQYV